MRDKWWNGKPQKVNYSLGVPKGMQVILQERRIDTREMVANDVKEVLANHLDFMFNIVLWKVHSII